MTPKRWQQVKKILAEALERKSAERPGYLDEVCGDPSIRKDVESFIAAHEQGDASFIEHSCTPSPALHVGDKLASYEIVAFLGAGGMGEVYQAHDSKLGRDVAIKILATTFIDATDRLSRFRREARMLASLNHPNIAVIHGLEESDDVHYLVMELVPGDTLAERQSAGPMGCTEALEIGVQIAAGPGSGSRKGSLTPGSETRQCKGDAGRKGEGPRLWFGEGVCA